MDYETFKTLYQRAFNEMNRYTIGQVGSSHFAQKMAALADDHPDFLDRFEAEIEAVAFGA